MKTKKKPASKAARKKPPGRAKAPSALAMLRRRAADLRWAVEDVEEYRERVIDAMRAVSNSVSGAVGSLTSALSAIEANEARSLAILSFGIDGREENHRIELEPGASTVVDFCPQVEGMVDIQLSNLGRKFCYMTEATCLGRIFSSGSFVRAAVSAKGGFVISVTVARP